jgi:hypothetical protein
VDFKKLGNLLVIAGAAVLVAACLWWFSFYSSVVREIGQATGREGSVFDVVACLYSTSGICGLVASVAVLAGKTAYEPLLFWFGLAGPGPRSADPLHGQAERDGVRIDGARKDRRSQCPST